MTTKTDWTAERGDGLRRLGVRCVLLLSLITFQRTVLKHKLTMNMQYVL